jgi:hypothetical protein
MDRSRPSIFELIQGTSGSRQLRVIDHNYAGVILVSFTMKIGELKDALGEFVLVILLERRLGS